MGTGVTPLLLPLDYVFMKNSLPLRYHRSLPSQIYLLAFAHVNLLVVAADLPAICYANWVRGKRTFKTAQEYFFLIVRSRPRPISITQLNILLYLHM